MFELCVDVVDVVDVIDGHGPPRDQNAPGSPHTNRTAVQNPPSIILRVNEIELVMFARCAPRARHYTYIGAYNYWGTNDGRTDGTYISGGFCTAVRLEGASFTRN